MATIKPVRIRFLGDISFNDEYVSILESGKNPFAELEPVLFDADLVVGNLECLAAGSGENEKKVPRLKTSLKALEALRFLNVGVVSLATNHFYDNLEEGFDVTVQKLKELKISSLGAGRTEEQAEKPFVWEHGGLKFGFLNYVHSDTNPNTPPEAKIHVNEFELSGICKKVKALKSEVDRVILLLHWGGKCDYGYLPHKEQVAQAKSMIDAGADAIIGHHPHTFQASMIHKGKPIFFSLGNFCFGDIHYEGSIFRIRNSGRKGGILELSFDDEKVGCRVFGFELDTNGFKLNHAFVKGFRRWTNRLKIVLVVPGAYKLYYYLLSRWEPVHFHAQLNNTTMVGVAINKFKRILRIG